MMNMTPFKNLDMMSRERSIGSSNFLPSLNEYKTNILLGKAIKNDSGKEKRLMMQQSKSFKRSGTILLGSIKEDKKDEEVGIVPKDLGFGMLKDLIDLVDDE
jgi:hypothetical protein